MFLLGVMNCNYNLIQIANLINAALPICIVK